MRPRDRLSELMDKLPALPPTPPGISHNKELALYNFTDWSLQFPGVSSSRFFTDIIERLISLDIHTPELLAFHAFNDLDHLFQDNEVGSKRYLCDRKDATEWVRSWLEGAQLAGLSQHMEPSPFVPLVHLAIEDSAGISDHGLASAIFRLSKVLGNSQK